ncbi:hypothetical protein HUS23_09330 [Ectothiorhodospiraceae bacterium 2226]|nr:hypothetical protein HUS23_09330 [Ectothiorhodospiraceae bacterium 2226]
MGLALWEQLLLGVLVLLVLLWFGPGIKAVFKQSSEAQERDWMGVLVPIAFVVLFVLLLIMLV